MENIFFVAITRWLHKIDADDDSQIPYANKFSHDDEFSSLLKFILEREIYIPNLR